jgi:DUF309 family protein family protein
VTLPLALRNRLAGLILDALHDAEARRGLEALAAVCDDPTALSGAAELPKRFPRDLFEERDGGLRVRGGWTEHAAELGDRTRRAWRMLRARELVARGMPLAATLDAAALLFDTGLYFEVHELLEPHWLRARGDDREALQGLIQVTVGFQHLANGNVAGARSLLREGSARIEGTSLEGLDLDPFARGARACLAGLPADDITVPRRFDWMCVPRFPGPVAP